MDVCVVDVVLVVLVSMAAVGTDTCCHSSGHRSYSSEK